MHERCCAGSTGRLNSRLSLIILCSGLLSVPLAASATDSDMDGVDNSVDNCTTIPNTSQNDTDADGIGNRCDADFDNDCFVDLVDQALLMGAFGADEPVFDLSEPPDGTVSASDFAIFLSLFGNPPGQNASLSCHSADPKAFISFQASPSLIITPGPGMMLPLTSVVVTVVLPDRPDLLPASLVLFGEGGFLLLHGGQEYRRWESRVYYVV